MQRCTVVRRDENAGIARPHQDWDDRDNPGGIRLRSKAHRRRCTSSALSLSSCAALYGASSQSTAVPGIKASKPPAKVNELTISPERDIEALQDHGGQTSGLERLCLHIARLNVAGMPWHKLPKITYRVFRASLPSSTHLRPPPFGGLDRSGRAGISLLNPQFTAIIGERLHAVEELAELPSPVAKSNFGGLVAVHSELHQEPCLR